MIWKMTKIRIIPHIFRRTITPERTQRGNPSLGCFTAATSKPLFSRFNRETVQRKKGGKRAEAGSGSDTHPTLGRFVEVVLLQKLGVADGRGPLRALEPGCRQKCVGYVAPVCGHSCVFACSRVCYTCVCMCACVFVFVCACVGVGVFVCVYVWMCTCVRMCLRCMCKSTRMLMAAGGWEGWHRLA